jgi:hypothetical protein
MNEGNDEEGKREHDVRKANVVFRESVCRRTNRGAARTILECRIRVGTDHVVVLSVKI